MIRSLLYTLLKYHARIRGYLYAKRHKEEARELLDSIIECEDCLPDSMEEISRVQSGEVCDKHRDMIP